MVELILYIAANHIYKPKLEFDIFYHRNTFINIRNIQASKQKYNSIEA